MGKRGPKSKELFEECQKTGKHAITLNDQVEHFPTPVASARSGRNRKTGKGEDLGWVVRDRMYPTPAARDWKDGLDPKPHGRHSESLPIIINQSDGGSLNPTWVEWLMGYPCGWTVLEDWAMQWFRPKRGKRLKD